jgi:hypothetical protein
MKLIQTQTVTTAGPSITFSSIPQNFTDVLVLFSLRSDRNDTAADVSLSLNGSTTNFTSRDLISVAAGDVRSYSYTSNYLGPTNAAQNTSNTFGNSRLYIANYSGSTNKSWSLETVTENNASLNFMSLMAGLWSNTAAITSLTLGNGSFNFVAGSTVSLYGIGGAGDGYKAPKATGGVISYSGNYIIHSFFASGTFTPTANLTDVEYLVVAGGAGGGGRRAGGGGAGGYRSSVVGAASGGGASAESRLSLTSGTAYTVTVGAGGAAGPDATRGSDGGNSVFGSITSTGGGGGGAYDGVLTGRPGGSGGGGARNDSGVSDGGAGTTNEGFRGGKGILFGNSGGGGGGAGQIGPDSPDVSIGAAGGNGVSSSITGSSVTRAGGGGGGSVTGGAGGTGGGSAGGSNAVGSAATANSGSGGGGGGAGSFAGGNGGSGIVVVRYLA